MSKISARRQNAKAGAAEDYEAKRQEILRIGATVFREFGYDGATVDEIARRAELDRASLYYYFKGKKELFREMIGVATVGNVETAEEIASVDAPADEKLCRLIVALFESYDRHYPYLFVYLQEEMNRLAADKSEWGANIMRLNLRFNAAVIAIVREGREAGLFAFDTSDKVVVAGVLGMCNWSFRWYRKDGALSAEEIAMAFSRIVLNGLKPR